MTWSTFSAIIQQTLIITIFILGMMMIIEYINVRTSGLWSKKLQKSPWIQIVLGALMGIIPGCLGTYTMVSLYVHRVISFPALAATLIATSGDEAFFMFSMFPKDAAIITVILLAVAIIVGSVLQITMKNKFIGLIPEKEFPLHDDDHHEHHDHHIHHNIRNISFVRALLITLCVTVLALVISGVIDGSHQLNLMMGGATEESVMHADAHHADCVEMHDAGCCEHHAGEAHHHDHEGEADWIRITLIALFAVILLIVIRADEHFLNEHLWEHVIKVHLPKIFLWTFGMILGLSILNNFINVQNWITENLWIVLIIAILIGIIPESGPHLIFVILFWQGSLPMSILLASSIVQDGHGSLPLLAESRKAFFASKVVGIAAGLAVGALGLMFGF